MKYKITLKDIAEITGVSANTVSLALRNSPRINENTKNRIQIAAKKLKYHPNILARQFSLQKTNIVCLIVPSIEVAIFPGIATGIESILSNSGFNLFFYNSHDDPQKEAEQLNLLMEMNVAGIIIAPAQEKSNVALLQEIQQLNIPLVMIDRFLPEIATYFVGTNDRDMAFCCVEYLIKLGHQDIGFIVGPSNTYTADERLMGYRRALEKYGIEYREKLLAGWGFYSKHGIKGIIELLRLKPRPTAVFCINDAVAIGAMKVLLRLGIKVPDEISISCFFHGINVVNRLLRTPMTGIHQPAYSLGIKAAEILLDLINNVKTPKIEKIFIPSRFVIGSSCSKPWHMLA
jgi:LacI family transcriptional regulator